MSTAQRHRRDQGSRLVWRIVPLGYWGENGRRVTTGYLVELHGVGIDEHGMHVGPIVDVARFDTAAAAREALAAVPADSIDDEAA